MHLPEAFYPKEGTFYRYPLLVHTSQVCGRAVRLVKGLGLWGSIDSFLTHCLSLIPFLFSNQFLNIFNMINAKVELLNVLKNLSPVVCAVIKIGQNKIILKNKHSKDEYESFLNRLDFEYDNGYGSQELYGTIWLKDGKWLSRTAFDGSERWEHNQLPKIPKECF